MNRYLAAFIAHYSVIREPTNTWFDYENWEQRFRASSAEYQAAFTALLDEAYPLARVALTHVAYRSTQSGRN